MPAAAVIPAPRAYIKVVAVKPLVVGCLPRASGPPAGCVSGMAWASPWGLSRCLTVWCGTQGFYFEEIRVLQAGPHHEYQSME